MAKININSNRKIDFLLQLTFVIAIDIEKPTSIYIDENSCKMVVWYIELFLIQILVSIKSMLYD